VRNPSDHNRVEKMASPVQILSQIIPIYFNIIISYRLVFRSGLFPSAVRTEIARAFLGFYVSHMHSHLPTRPFHPLEFDVLNSAL